MSIGSRFVERDAMEMVGALLVEEVIGLEPSAEVGGPGDVPQEAMSRDLDREILRIVSERQRIGARRIAQILGEQRGSKCSESTISRRLTELDRLNLTTSTGRSGRSVTVQGQRIVSAATQGTRRLATFERVLVVETAKQLVDWLVARRAVEVEAVYLCALHRTDADLQAIEDAHFGVRGGLGESDRLEVPKQVTGGLLFHKVICGSTRNEILGGLAGLIFDTHLDPLEDVLHLITVSRGEGAEALLDHTRIFESIKHQAPEEARRAMEAHIDYMIELVRRFVLAAGDSALSGVIRLAAAAASGPKEGRDGSQVAHTVGS